MQIDHLPLVGHFADVSLPPDAQDGPKKDNSSMPFQFEN